MISKFQGETRWLSNFQAVEITYEGITYPTTEHAYQGAKAMNVADAKMIASLATPGEAKRAGQTIVMRPGWVNPAVRIKAMEDINRLKFQDPGLRAKLLATGDQELIEGNNWGDKFWGQCEGVGTNHLGRILMKIREEIRNEISDTVRHTR